MAKDMNDLFMYITNENGARMNGESSLAIAKNDPFMKDDFSDADYDSYANFFDVTDFDFSIHLDANDKSTAAGATAGKTGSATTPPPATGGGGFDDWYMQEDPLNKLENQYDVKTITGSIGKVLDATSPKLFENCCLRKTFKKAVLVKRAFTGSVTKGGGGFGISASASAGFGGASASASLSLGGASTSDSQAEGYIRIEMENVRITNLSWSDGDLVEEKLRFKCTKLLIKYRTQTNDGQLSKAPIEMLKWEAKAGRDGSTSP